MNSFKAACTRVLGSSLEDSRGGSTLREYADLESMVAGCLRRASPSRVVRCNVGEEVMAGGRTHYLEN